MRGHKGSTCKRSTCIGFLRTRTNNIFCSILLYSILFYPILYKDKAVHFVTPSSVGNAISVCNGYLTDKELLIPTSLERETSALSCVISHSMQVVTASVE